MLTNDEQRVVRGSLKSWPKGKANLFMRVVMIRGNSVNTEEKALTVLTQKPDALRFASPELALASYRNDLTTAGIERAFRALCSHCRSQAQSYIYLELLDHNPEFLMTLFSQSDEGASFEP